MADWFRSWHGAPTDPKWLAIARRSGSSPVVVSAVAWALFDHASQNQDRGSIDGFDPESYAAWAGIEESEVVAIVTAMRDKGIVEGVRLAAWERRQPKREDDSAERVRAFRERRNEMKRDVTQGNAPDKSRVDTEKIVTREEGERSGESSRAPARLAFAIPENLEMTVDDAEQAKLSGLSETETEAEWGHFRSYYEARQSERRTDWHAQWRSWLGKRAQFPTKTIPNGTTNAPMPRRDKSPPSSGVVSRADGQRQRQIIGRD